MAKQTMKLRKIEFDNYLIGQNGQPVKQYRVGIVQPAKVTSAKIIKNICDHTGYPRAQVKGVLDSAAECINDYLEIGATVELENFVTIKPLIKVKAVTDKKLATADTIKTRTIRCTAIGEFADMAKAWGFQLQGSDVEKGESTDDNGGVDDEGTPAGGGNNNNNAGNQQGGLTPSEVTYTFKYHDNTEDSRVGQPGEAVDAPEPDEGYNWNTVVPTIFGNSNRTFTEVAVAQGGGAETYTATLHIGSSYVTRTGAAGSPLDLPALESGYTWPSNMPTVMPAQDFTAYAIEGEQDMTEYTLTVQHEGETIRTEQLHADDIVFLGTAPAGYKWTNTPRYSKMPARNWTISTAEV